MLFERGGGAGVFRATKIVLSSDKPYRNECTSLSYHNARSSTCLVAAFHPTPYVQRRIERGLRAAFPLLRFDPLEAELLKTRRCHACVAVTGKIKSLPQSSVAARARIMKLPPLDANGPYVLPLEDTLSHGSVLTYRLMPPIMFFKYPL